MGGLFPFGGGVAGLIAYVSTKFGKLILRKIIKFVAIRCHILQPKCTQFDFTALPRPLAGLKGPKKMRKEGREGRRGEKRTRREGESEGEDGEEGNLFFAPDFVTKFGDIEATEVW